MSSLLTPREERLIRMALDAALSEVRRQGGPEYLLKEALASGELAGRSGARMLRFSPDPAMAHPDREQSRSEIARMFVPAMNLGLLMCIDEWIQLAAKRRFPRAGKARREYAWQRTERARRLLAFWALREAGPI